jgi:hypothetical protein
MMTLHRWRGVGAAGLFLVGFSGGLDGQTVYPWSYQVQAGYTAIDLLPQAGGPIVACGLTREILWEGLFRAGTDFALSKAGDGFVFFAGGLEFRHSPAAELTLFAKMNWGYLNGLGYSGSFVAGTGGFLARIGARTRLLFGFSHGDHGERGGPHSAVIGLERGFGTPTVRTRTPNGER